MHSLEQLEKQQVGLRLPKYLIESIDEFTREFSLNRTDIITEALKSYISNQKEKMFYDGFDNSVKQMKDIMSGKIEEVTLGELIDELETDINS